jgi:hypothetical protein
MPWLVELERLQKNSGKNGPADLPAFAIAVGGSP